MLTSEQTAVLASWQFKKAQRKEIYLKLKNKELTCQEAMDQLLKIDGDSCEHGRHYSKDCYECETLSELLHPESFDG